jgi:hypothetical protein
MLQGAKQEMTEPAQVLVGVFQRAGFQEHGNEALGQVLGFLGGMAVPPHVAVQRRPIHAAKG